MKCCRCGKGIRECGSALHAIDPPRTPSRRWACERCMTDKELAAIPNINKELHGLLNRKAQAYGTTEAEAIAAWNTRAELGSELPYDELLRCLENDWNISASWDGLRKFWCIELTEEGVKLRDATHGTLTAERVRAAIFNGSSYASYDGAQYYANGINMQAIADELNVELGSGTCENASELNTDGVAGYHFTCSECGLSVCASMGVGEIELSGPRSFHWKVDGKYEFERCPRCGRKVER